MHKLSAIALATVAAHEINVFAPQNFLQKNLIQSLLRTVTMDAPLTLGEVTYGQCDDDAGAFTLDMKQTTNSPNPIVKGQKVSLMLRGIVSEGVDVDNVHVHVDWNGSTLYDQDIAMTEHYDSTYQYDVSWDVPSYAPSGSYAVTMKGHGKTDEVSDGIVMCTTANFDL